MNPPHPKPVRAPQIEQLKQFAALKDQGILTEEEFAAKKARILGSDPRLGAMRPAYRERVEELADSAALVSDPDGLRRHLAADGYLFFRGLLPVGEVQAAGRAVLARVRAGG